MPDITPTPAINQPLFNQGQPVPPPNNLYIPGKRKFIIIGIILIVIGITALFIYKNYKNPPNLSQNTSKVATDSAAIVTPSVSPESMPKFLITPDLDTIVANWKSYSNREHSYTIKYPPAWHVYEIKDYLDTVPDNASYVIITPLSSFPDTSSGNNYPGMWIGGIEGNPDEIIKAAQIPDARGIKTINVEEIIINNYKAYIETQEKNPSTRFYIPDNNKSGYITIIMNTSSTKEPDKTIAEQIIQTFKFTK